MSWSGRRVSVQGTSSQEDMNAQWPRGAESADGNTTSRPAIVMIASPFPTHIFAPNEDATSGFQMAGTMGPRPGSSAQDLTCQNPSPVPSPAMGRRSSTEVLVQKKPLARSVPLQRTPSGGLFLAAGQFEVTPSGDLHISGSFTSQLGSSQPGSVRRSKQRPAASRDRRKSEFKERPVPIMSFASQISVRSADSSSSRSSRRSSSSSMEVRSPAAIVKKGSKGADISQDIFQLLPGAVTKPKPCTSVPSKKSLRSQQNASPNQMNLVIQIPSDHEMQTNSVSITVVSDRNVNQATVLRRAT